jgi:exodeoxyribonuclease VII large subunit
MGPISPNLEPKRRIYSVSELTHAIRNLLEDEFWDIWVAGEISGTKCAASGHYYFTLKDEEAVLACVCYRSAARLLRFKPQDGIAVLARGRLDVYPPRGAYQLQVEALEPLGYGALQLAFEQLKKRLAAEGLFDPARKRPLPLFPRRIGLVTSPDGAAIRDLVSILCRRLPGIHLRLYPVPVQGEGAASAIAEAIDYFGRSGWPDVLIVGRGGGSLEDLWAFNEELVARAIAACPVPVISAVGHESDFTIADFVADLRAPTPSAAAELVAPERRQLAARVEEARRKLEQALRYRLVRARNEWHRRGIERPAALLRRAIGRHFERLDELDERLRQAWRRQLEQCRRNHDALEARLRRQDLRLRLGEVRRRLEALRAAMAERARLRLATSRGRLERLAAMLEQLSPLRILERGYAIVHDSAGRIVRNAATVSAGDLLAVRLHRGRLEVLVTQSRPD